MESHGAPNRDITILQWVAALSWTQPNSTGLSKKLHRGDFRPKDHAVMIPTVPPYHAALPAVRPQGRDRSGPAASRPRLHRGFGTPHPAPPQNVSGDAPQ
jgi:hypothetical protein